MQIVKPISKFYLLSLFLRQLFALFYDVLLLLSIFLISSLFIILFTRGEPIPPLQPTYQFFLFLLIYLFFVGFWSQGGQTTGMRAWRLKVVTKKDEQALSLLQASIRFFWALFTQSCFGLGWFWMLLDPDNQTLYDRLSGTKIILVQKR